MSAVSYAVGQCAWYVGQTLSWIPSGLGNAKDWLANAPKHGLMAMDTQTMVENGGSAPIGSVIVFGAGNESAAHPAGPDGHVAIITGYQSSGLPVVSEMNWKGGIGKSDTRQLTNLNGVIGYILPPGTEPGPIVGSVDSDTNGANTGAAQAAAAAATVGGLSGQSIPQPANLLSDAGAVGGFLGVITQASTWFTVGFFVVAGIIGFMGLRILTGHDAAPNPSGALKAVGEGAIGGELGAGLAVRSHAHAAGRSMAGRPPKTAPKATAKAAPKATVKAAPTAAPKNGRLSVAESRAAVKKAGYTS